MEWKIHNCFYIWLFLFFVVFIHTNIHKMQQKKCNGKSINKFIISDLLMSSSCFHVCCCCCCVLLVTLHMTHRYSLWHWKNAQKDVHHFTMYMKKMRHSFTHQRHFQWRANFWLMVHTEKNLYHKDWTFDGSNKTMAT